MPVDFGLVHLRAELACKLPLVSVEQPSMSWRVSDRADPRALPIADRHYNRQKPGTPQFVPPGSCVVFTCTTGVALWVTSWPMAQYTKHAWAGAWVNSAFRRESGPQASLLIREALAATRWHYGTVPRVTCQYCGTVIAMVTFIDRDKVRHKRDFGRCYVKAGFKAITYLANHAVIDSLGCGCQHSKKPIAPAGHPANVGQVDDRIISIARLGRQPQKCRSEEISH